MYRPQIGIKLGMEKKGPSDALSGAFSDGFSDGFQ